MSPIFISPQEPARNVTDFKNPEKNIFAISISTHGLVDRVLDSRSEGLGFDSQHWSYLEVSGKLRIPHTASIDLAVMCSWVNSCRLHLHPPCEGKDSQWNMRSHACPDNTFTFI